VPYQSAANTTGFSAAGTVGQVLLSGGTASPTWSTSAPQSTNITGGVAGAMPYQSATDTTAFTAAGTNGQVLVSTGTTAPIWSNTAPEAGNLSGGVAGSIPWQSGTGITSYSGVGTLNQVFVSGGAGAPTWTSTLSIGGEVITQGGSTGSPLQINSTNTRGGVNFAEIMAFTNANGGATNPNKFLRMNNTGTLELINSAYSATIFSIADTGITTIGGAIWQGGNQTNTNPNTGNNNGIRGPAGYITYQDNLGNIVLGDYTQTGHDTWVETGRDTYITSNGVQSTNPNATYTLAVKASGQLQFGTNATNPLVGYGAPKVAIYNNSGQDGMALISANGSNSFNCGKVAPNSNGTGVTGSFCAWVGNGSASTTTYGTISVNGSGVSYNTSSDARLKENVVTLTGGLDKVKALRPVSYDWIDNQSSDIGFIAQEAESIVPEAVTAPIEDNPAHQYYQMDLTRLVPVLTAAIQEQQAIIEALQARLDKAGL